MQVRDGDHGAAGGDGVVGAGGGVGVDDNPLAPDLFIVTQCVCVYLGGDVAREGVVVSEVKNGALIPPGI